MVTFYKPKQNASLTGRQVSLQVERIDYEANGIGSYQNKIAFISGALPGEQVQVKVTEDKAAFIKAKTERVLVASPFRATPFCRYFNQCGGCQLQYLNPHHQQQLKQQGIDELLRHQTGLSSLPWQSVLSGADQGYRRKARIGIFYDKKLKKIQVGFRQNASKSLINIAHCAVLSPVLQPVFSVLQQVVPTLAQPSTITHAEVVDADGQAFVIVRHVAPLTTAEQQAFVQAWPEAHWVGEDAPGMFTAWQAEQKQPAYTLAKQALTLRFAADDFIQVNAEVNQQMVEQALSWLAPTADDTILDLYAGMGNFSLALAQCAKLVHGVEGLTKMVQQASANAQANQLTNAHFWQADLHLPWGKVEWNKPIYQKILLDPARAGAEGAVNQIISLKPAQILYVSCNPATFARDAKLLLNAGYQLQKIAGVDMFPHTSHLELMALFSRQ